jgi:hypothetical protein
MQKIRELIMGAVNTVWGFLTSKDMKALYWYSLTQFIAAGGDILVQRLTEWNPDNIITVGVGLVLSRITKKLNK